MKYLSDKRSIDKWWGVYPRIHGNLIFRTYLDFVKALNPGPDTGVIKRAEYNGPKNVVLYLDGDSYTWNLVDTAFMGICGFHYIDRYEGGFFNLDSSKRNVLVIQYSERAVRECFGDLRIKDQVKDSSRVGKTASQVIASRTVYASFLPDIKPENLFNKNINQNLQFNLFNYQFIIPMFEYKAALNYYCFKRASGDAVLSKDGQYLFLKETISGTDIGSSYVNVDASEVTHIVDNCNALYDHFRASGFKEVYLSLVPNPSSIVQPGGYNQLIPRIQNDPHLRMKIIDAYGLLNSEPQRYFYHGDTHWNMDGKQRWVDMVNEKLMMADTAAIH